MKLLAGVLAVVLILLGILVSAWLLVHLVVRIDSKLDPLKGVKAWEIYRVEEPNARVYCLARRVADNRFDLGGVSAMIAEKNHLRDYNLYPGQEILLPVFKAKKELASQGFLSVKRCIEKDGTGKCAKEEVVIPGG